MPSVEIPSCLVALMTLFVLLTSARWKWCIRRRRMPPDLRLFLFKVGESLSLGGQPSGLSLSNDGQLCVIATNKALLCVRKQVSSLSLSCSVYLTHPYLNHPTQGTAWKIASSTPISFGASGVSLSPAQNEADESTPRQDQLMGKAGGCGVRGQQDPHLLSRWRQALARPGASGASQLSDQGHESLLTYDLI